MDTKDDIFIKLELTKNPKNGSLTITAHLNPAAPNITSYEDHISWMFTPEEIDFLSDAINLLRDKKQTHTTVQKTFQTNYPTRSTDAAIDETIGKHSRDTKYTHDTQDTIDAIIKAKTNQH